jgi:hypothetical protein
LLKNPKNPKLGKDLLENTRKSSSVLSSQELSIDAVLNPQKISKFEHSKGQKVQKNTFSSKKDPASLRKKPIDNFLDSVSEVEDNQEFSPFEKEGKFLFAQGPSKTVNKF